MEVLSVSMRSRGTHRDWYICCTWPKGLWTFAYPTLRKSAKDGAPDRCRLGERDSIATFIPSLACLRQIGRFFSSVTSNICLTHSLQLTHHLRAPHYKVFSHVGWNVEAIVCESAGCQRDVQLDNQLWPGAGSSGHNRRANRVVLHQREAVHGSVQSSRPRCPGDSSGWSTGAHAGILGRRFHMARTLRATRPWDLSRSISLQRHPKQRPSRSCVRAQCASLYRYQQPL
jgi:hypothetical protein